MWGVGAGAGRRSKGEDSGREAGWVGWGGWGTTAPTPDASAASTALSKVLGSGVTRPPRSALIALHRAHGTHTRTAMPLVPAQHNATRPPGRRPVCRAPHALTGGAVDKRYPAVIQPRNKQRCRSVTAVVTLQPQEVRAQQPREKAAHATDPNSTPRKQKLHAAQHRRTTAGTKKWGGGERKQGVERRTA